MVLSVEQSFAIAGGAGTFPIPRESLLGGVRQFDDFRARLGIARDFLNRTLVATSRVGDGSARCDPGCSGAYLEITCFSYYRGHHAGETATAAAARKR